MAAIWEAEHQTLGRSVAVKFLHVLGPPQSEASQRFVREARVAAAIKHRNVVDIIDFGLTDDDHRPYMVMELLEGQALGAFLDARGRLGIADAAHIVSDVLRGLAAVHDAGIVHRDLKPDNIFLVNDEDGPFPKLLDFGLSRRVGRGDMTAEGLILGTPDYMSPEQAKGQRHIDARTDIYSMGVIFYELVTGQMPFDGGSLADLLGRVVEGKYVALDERLPDAPPLLVDIIHRSMHRDRNERYANAREMRAALATANLAPFAHGESGLMLVEPMRISPSFPQLTNNPPSGVFSDAGPDRSEKSTLDAVSIDELRTRDSDALPGEPTRMEDLDNEVTRAVPPPPPRRPPAPPGKRSESLPEVPVTQHTPVAYAQTMPSAMAVVLPEARRDPSLGRRVDDSAGVFKTSEADAPKKGGGWLSILLVVALASVAGGVIVYWMQGGPLPFDLPGADPLVTVVDDAGPADAGAQDAGMDAGMDTGIDAPAPIDVGLDDAAGLDASELDASIGDASFEDAESIQDAGDEGVGEDGEEDAGRRRAIRRRRPRRRP
jgi:serine/threonine-protein kinase